MTRNDKKWLMKLRDCFYAGYSMPQYCRDRGYRQPLFAAYDVDFLWELYVQFSYDKRMSAEFRVFGEKTSVEYYRPLGFVSTLELAHQTQEPSEAFDAFDIIIVLAKDHYDYLFPPKKTVYITDLLDDIRTYVYSERPLLDYMRRHPGVRVVGMSKPLLNKTEPMSEDEKIIVKRDAADVLDRLKSGDEEEEYLPFEKLGYTREETIRLLTPPKVILQKDGSTRLADMTDPLVAVYNGYRKTAHQDDQLFEHSLWCVGGCVFYGYCAPYDKTFESYLQIKFNENEIRRRVVNASQFYWTRYQDLYYNLEKLPAEPGDIVLVWIDEKISNGIGSGNLPVFRAADLFDRPHNYGEVFADDNHICERGYEVLANKLYEWLQNNNYFEDWNYPDSVFAPIHYFGIPEWTGCLTERDRIYIDGADELGEWKRNLLRLRTRTGSIVMNCNPFTNGHLELIRNASEQCDRVYLFVVEEDKSFFSFSDRLEMVKRGVSGIENVTVIPSGKFILSSTTFEGYFNKENIQDREVDPSLDIELFASEIAPVLGINARFVGEEPLDNVTRQYNNAMKKILPKYGIELIEITRLTFEDEPISASVVRKELQQNNWDKIRKLVPETTYDFLRCHYYQMEL